jgi:hypothetical protein
MIEGTPAITITLPIQKPGAPDTLLRMSSAPLGMRVMRRRASVISAPVTFSHSCRMASARGSMSTKGPPGRLDKDSTETLRNDRAFASFKASKPLEKVSIFAIAAASEF